MYVLVYLLLLQFMVIMYKTKHSDFILSPLFDILENAISACRGMRDNM